jgi:hypothetical protein
MSPFSFFRLRGKSLCLLRCRNFQWLAVHVRFSYLSPFFKVGLDSAAEEVLRHVVFIQDVFRDHDGDALQMNTFG